MGYHLIHRKLQKTQKQEDQTALVDNNAKYVADILDRAYLSKCSGRVSYPTTLVSFAFCWAKCTWANTLAVG